MEDGFHIESSSIDDNELDNTATDNHAEGIEDDGTSTDLRDNTATGNRTDCAGDGLNPGTVTGNVCAEGSVFTVAGTID